MMVGQGPSYGYLEGGLQSGNFPLTNPLQKLVEKDKGMSYFIWKDKQSRSL